MKNRTNDQMRNMVTGKMVTVTEVNGENITFDDGKVLSKDKVEKCFEFITNETPLPTPTAVIDGGQLIVDDEKPEIGIMEPLEVIATMSGKVLFTIKNGEKKDLVLYNVEEETFTRNPDCMGIDEINVIYNKDDVLIYSVVSTNDRQVVNKEDEKNPLVVKDYRDRVYVLKNGVEIDTFSNLLLDGIFDTIDGELKLFFTRSKKLEEREDIDGYEFFTVSDMEGVDLVEIAITTVLDDETGEVVDTYTSIYSDHYSSISKIEQTYGPNGVIMVVTGNGIHIFNRHHMAIGNDVLAAVEKYPTLVRFTAASSHHNHDTFVLADSDYNTVAIRVKRVGGPVGYITTVE